MKKFKKVITFGMLLSALSLLIITQAVTATISVGNGSFASYASSDYLGGSIKSVTGIATAKSNIREVSSKAASSSLAKGKTSAYSYCNGLSSQFRYTVTNSGTATNGAYKAHNQSV